jgi:myo-inositol 2-dehydrogenase/D-chiro-inositol 1-dehydrogenase
VLRVAIVGAGGIARRHVEAVEQIAFARVTAVVDVDASKAEALARQAGARSYTALDECVDDVDVVHVLTPPSTRRAIVETAAEAGRDIVCEKPLAITLEDGEAIVAAAEAAGAKLMVAFNHRFRPGYSMVKRAADSGDLGDIITVWSRRMGRGIPSGYNWRTDPNLMCGMSVESLSHDIDLIRWIGGEIVDVRATIHASNPDLPGFDDNAHVVMRLANGGSAFIHASWSSYLGSNSRGVVGTSGAAEVLGPGLWDSAEYRWRTSDMASESSRSIDDAFSADSYVRENEDFLECVLNDREPSITGRDGLAALRVSHGILRSHHDGVVADVG